MSFFLVQRNAPQAISGLSAITSIVSVSKAYGNTDGGLALTIAVTGARGATIPVQFGAVSVPGTIVNATTITCVSPAHGVGAVDITIGSQTLAAAFNYRPATTTTYLAADFESNVLAPLVADISTGGTAVIDGSISHGGTKSAHVSVSGAVNSCTANLLCTFGGVKNVPLNSPTGLYQTFWVRTTTATMVAASAVGSPTAQIKLGVLRVNNVQPPPGWLVIGFGAAFGSAFNGEIVIQRDNGTITLLNTGVGLVDQTWMKIQTWYFRSGGIGFVMVWLDDVLVYSANSALFGDDGATDDYTWQLAMPFVQNNGTAVEIWVDDVTATNGYVQ